MVSPERQKHRARLRLRENADPLDCLDLSIQSSSLLSPSLHPHFEGSDTDCIENGFPFQVSPTEPSNRPAPVKNTGAGHLLARQRADAANGPLSALTNMKLDAAGRSPCAAAWLASGPLTPAANLHLRQDEMHPAPEHTPDMLSGKTHHSPSRQHRPADPRRESTVLFKGFTASTAETGLLEVEEIAEINGSPELLRVTHNPSSVTEPEADMLGASHSNAASPFQQAANAAHQHRSNDTQALSPAAASTSAAHADTANHNSYASSDQVPSVRGLDSEQDPELGGQEEGCSQSQGSAEAGPCLRGVKLQGTQAQARSSQVGGAGAAMRRSVGMRDSMCFFLQLEGAVEGQNGFAPEELDEVRRQSGGKASLPMVPEEENEEGIPQGAPQQQPSAPKLQLQPALSKASQQQQHSQHTRSAHDRTSHKERGAEHMQLPTASGRAEMLGQLCDSDLLVACSDASQQRQDAHLQEPSCQHQTDGTQCQATALRDCQSSPPVQQPSRHPISPAAQSSQTGEEVRPTQMHSQQRSAVSPARAAANRPVPLRAGTKAPAAKISPVMAHAVEHSSLSLSELAGVTRSRLRLPSSLNSPPKRASKAPLPKLATNSHLVKLAAAVPLPASPDGAGKLALEPTAAAALATAVAKPSHIPAPAVKASRLKKPTNTSGFFSSGRSFIGGASNSRYIALVTAASPKASHSPGPAYTCV
ncbi:hypothetical protein ABBQ32_006404 [Trebouxia sp. C0010 RCD-2024]